MKFRVYKTVIGTYKLERYVSTIVGKGKWEQVGQIEGFKSVQEAKDYAVKYKNEHTNVGLEEFWV